MVVTTRVETSSFRLTAGSSCLGSLLVSSDSNFALARYCSNGSLDNGINCGSGGFGSGGLVSTASEPNDAALSVAVQPDGKIVGAGHAGAGASIDFAVVRYCSDGTLDDGVNCGPGGFGVGGIAKADFGATDFANAVALQQTARSWLPARLAATSESSASPVIP